MANVFTFRFQQVELVVKMAALPSILLNNSTAQRISNDLITDKQMNTLGISKIVYEK